MAREIDKMIALYEGAEDRSPKAGDTAIMMYTNPYDASATVKSWVMGKGSSFTPPGTRTLERRED